MATQHLLDHPVAPAWTDHMAAPLGVLKLPFPLVAAVGAGTRLITGNQAATAQTGEDPPHPVVEAGFDRLEQIGQGPFTDGELEHLPKEPSQSLVADGMRIPQIGRHTLDGGPKGCAGLHPYRYRGYIGLPAVGTITAILLYTCCHSLDQWHLELGLDCVQLLIGLLDP